MTPRVSLDEFRALKRRAADKKAKRVAKAVELWKPRPGSASNRSKRKKAEYPSRKALKDSIVRLLGLLDMKLNGKECRLSIYCPQYPVIGFHPGDTSYHIISQKRGDSTRFLPEAVIWTCGPANFGEMMNRDIYRDKHVALFGKEFVERLESLSHKIKRYSHAELLELRAEIKRKVELA